MLKKLLLVLTLFAVMPAVCMEVAEDQVQVTIRTSDRQEFKIDRELVECSITLANLIEDAGTTAFVLPLPNVSGPIWEKIQALLPFVHAINTEVQDIEEKTETLRALLLSYDGCTLANLIAAFDYLDIQLLNDLAIDVAKRLDHTASIAFIKEAHNLDNPILLGLMIEAAKNIDIKKTAFGEIANLPEEIRNPIIVGQMIRMLGSVPGKQHALCNGHTDCVRSVCVTQDDNTIVSGSLDFTLRKWNMDGTEREKCYVHTTSTVSSRCVTQDGNTIVSRSKNDDTVHIGNRDGTQRAICNGHTSSVTSICITQDGNTIVTGSCDGTVRIWNLDGIQRAICNGHTDSVISVCVTQDGNTIVSGSCDGTVRIWNMGGTQRALCNGHARSVNSVCVTQDGNTIVSGSWDSTVRIWNIDGTQHAICNGHTDSVNSVCVTQDGNTIISGSNDRTVRIWDISLLNSISTMDYEQAQAIWNYLQSDSAKNWDHIQVIFDGKKM